MALNLCGNNLGQLLKYDLAEVMQAIPDGVTSLHLRDDLLQAHSVNDLGIKPHVKRLNLFSRHHPLIIKNLRVLWSTLPVTVTSLDLRELVVTESSLQQLHDASGLIPKTIKEVILPGKHFRSPELLLCLKAIISGLHRSGMTISFEGQQIFAPGNREANDALLKKLHSAAGGRSLCFTNTGESDFVRGLSALVGLSKQVVPIGPGVTGMPLDVIHHIASFLVSPEQEKGLNTLLSSSVVCQVMNRESINSNKIARIESKEPSLFSRFLSIFSRQIIKPQKSNASGKALEKGQNKSLTLCVKN